MDKKCSLLLLFLLILSHSLEACTTAIVSGSGSEDGRPILWKHRDSGFMENKIIFDDSGKFKYIGLINSKDYELNEVWAGANETGFAIMNAASYNLNIDDTTTLKDQEGLFMKRALQTCENLADFENILIETTSKRGIEANFGVIDAHGGAAYYETGNHSYTKLDVNDPEIAPFGYLVRTNFSSTGDKDKGYGYIRYMTAEQLFYQASAKNSITPQFILKNVDRSLQHSLTNVDLAKGNLPQSKDDSHFVPFRDYINRYSSTASFVAHGVKKGEDTSNMMIWSLLGFQPCSIAVPLWVAAGDVIPSIVTASDSANAPLCEKALQLKESCFSIKRGSGKDYLDLAMLLNQKGNGYMQLISPLEHVIVTRAEKLDRTFRDNEFDRKASIEFYEWVDQFLRSKYLEIE